MLDALFDMPAVAVAPPTKLSADARRTIRNNALIDRGRHPATGRELLPGEHACADCAHARCFQGTGRRRYWKCNLVPITNGAGTDIRISWPACTLWVSAGRLVECDPCAGEGWVPLPTPPKKRSWSEPTRARCDACQGRGQVVAPTTEGDDA